MSYVKQKGNNNSYWVRDSNCLSCECFVPGEYQHRGAIGAGGTKSSHTSLTCLTNAYSGCPDEVISNKEILNENKNKGWRNL